MKWFFCWCEDTDDRHDHNWKDLIRASVCSAKKNTNLEPNLIYDGKKTEFIDELMAHGVNVIFHRLTFSEQIVRHQPNNSSYQAVARGAFLRFDIPVVAPKDEQFVLYTDADVIFMKNPDLHGYRPEFIAAAPQFDRGQRLDMNSGVMILNLETFRNIHQKLVAFTCENLSAGLDQEVLRLAIGTNYLLLPDTYNWKPYWGINADCDILHWHGPKPETTNKLLNNSDTTFHADWQKLFERNPDAYKFYGKMYQTLLAEYGQKTIAAAGRRGALIPNFGYRPDDKTDRIKSTPRRDKSLWLTLFDEAYYLHIHPDVRQSVESGSLPSGRSHYESHGYDERRRAFAFDPVWYAAAYPKVLDEVSAGNFLDCEHHYVVIGRLIGCLPYKPAPLP